MRATNNPISLIEQTTTESAIRERQLLCFCYSVQSERAKTPRWPIVMRKTIWPIHYFIHQTISKLQATTNEFNKQAQLFIAWYDITHNQEKERDN